MDHTFAPGVEHDEQHALVVATERRLVDDWWADPVAAQRDWDAELAALEASLAARTRRERVTRRSILDGAPGSAGLRAAEEVLDGAAACTEQQASDPTFQDVLGDAVLSAFAASHRVASYVLWLEVRATARLLTMRSGRTPSLPRRRRSGRPAREGDDVLVDDEVAAELALAAGITIGMASSRVEAAKALVIDGRLPATAALLQQGMLDWARVAAVIGRTRELSAEAARAVESLLYATPNLHGRGLTRFEHALDAALLTVDADAVEARRRRNHRERRVGLQTGRDGTAFLTATGPAEALVAAFNGLDTAARQERTQGDGRTLDQLRFDLLVTATTSGYLPVAAAVLPVPPGCSPGRPDAAAPPSPQGAPGDGPADGADRQVAAGRPWFTSEWPQVRVNIDVTVSAETLMGLDEAAGTLRGYGPIPAEAVRDLVTHGVFRCVVVDGTHGTVLGVGRSTFTGGYTPGSRLRLLTEHAFPVCAVPGCGRAGHRCDLDHQIPYAAGGATCICNVRPLCRTHHRLKTAGLLVPVWTGPPGEPGSELTWVTRTGRAYVAEDHTAVPPHRARTPSPARGEPACAPGGGDPPPY